MNKKIIYQLNDKNFDNNVLKQKGIVLVDFWAEWCSPCKILSPILEEVAQKNKSKIIFYKINIDVNPLTAPKYNIKSIPTLILFKNGEVVDRNIGLITKKQLEVFIDKHLL